MKQKLIINMSQYRAKKQIAQVDLEASKEILLAVGKKIVRIGS